MCSPVNICGSFRTHCALLGVLMMAACVARPGLSAAWFDPVTAGFNGGVGRPGALSPADDASRRAHARDLDRQWARHDVEVLEERLASQRTIAGVERVKSQTPRAEATCEPARSSAPATRRAKPPRASPPARRARSDTAGARAPEATRRSVKPRVTEGATPKASPRPKVSTEASRRKATGSKISPRPAPARRGDRGAMGDGSVPGELVAAARRLVGLGYDDERNTFLRHLLVSAAVDIRVTAARSVFDHKALEAMRARGWHLDRRALRKLRVGDLLVFQPGAQLVAVVEQVSPSGTVTCIGPVFGRVRRFVANLGTPLARRNETTGEILNDRLTGPGATQGGRSSATLAGELFKLGARPALR